MCTCICKRSRGNRSAPFIHVNSSDFNAAAGEFNLAYNISDALLPNATCKDENALVKEINMFNYMSGHNNNTTVIDQGIIDRRSL